MKTEPITILLAEDDDGHATLVAANLERAGFVNTLVRARDGVEAIKILESGSGPGGGLPEGPLLLLLDIKMPRMDGLEVLEKVRKSPAFRSIPVIMLTTTDDPREIERCYELGCNVYISKPIEYDAFIEAVTRLGLFLQIVQIPVRG